MTTPNRLLVERIAEKGYNLAIADIAKTRAVPDCEQWKFENEVEQCKALWRSIATMAIEEVNANKDTSHG